MIEKNVILVGYVLKMPYLLEYSLDRPEIWNRYMVIKPCVATRGGGLAMILGTDVRLESPDPHPIHILRQVKNMTHSYTSHSEKCTHSYAIFF